MLVRPTEPPALDTVTPLGAVADALRLDVREVSRLAAELGFVPSQDGLGADAVAALRRVVTERRSQSLDALVADGQASRLGY